MSHHVTGTPPCVALVSAAWVRIQLVVEVVLGR